MYSFWIQFTTTLYTYNNSILLGTISWCGTYTNRILLVQNFPHTQLGVEYLKMLYVCQMEQIKQFCILYFSALKCPLPTIMHGSLNQNTMPDVGQSVSVVCDSGYQIVGNAVMNCLANETFDAIPQCNGMYSIYTQYSLCVIYNL